jgi:hypothetical protein
MGKLLEGLEILCTDYDYILKKRGESFIEGRIPIKEIRYVKFLQISLFRERKNTNVRTSIFSN